MKVLVTGCAGFIGAKVAGLLLEQGHAVLGVDNLNNAYDVRLKQWRLEQLQPRSGFSFCKLDVGDHGALAQLFATHSFEAVINLAARAGVRQSVENPWVYYDTNVTGTLNLLELCKAHQVSKFILASTSSLYGVKNPVPFREDANTDGPLSPYAASKKAAEVLCHTYHYLHGLDITVLRYFTVYGPAGRPDMSIFRFIRWIAEQEPLTLYGDGTQTRDFSYVDDIARGTILSLKPLGYEIMNLGSDRPVSMNAVIRLLEGLLNKPAQIQHQPSHLADVPGTHADISKANRVLGWKPQVLLESGLEQAVHWYLQHRNWVKALNLL